MIVKDDITETVSKLLSKKALRTNYIPISIKKIWNTVTVKILQSFWKIVYKNISKSLSINKFMF